VAGPLTEGPDGQSPLVDDPEGRGACEQLEKPCASKGPRLSMLVVLALALSLGLYLPFLSIQHNPNGINEAISVEKGGRGLFSPNHMLYRPLGWSVWHVMRGLGYWGRSLVILQVISALAGAAAVAAAFVVYQALAGHWAPGMLAAFVLATSSYFWGSSIDAFYIGPAAAFAATAMAVVTVRAGRRGTATTAGALVALSILVWQASVFLLPSIAAAVVLCGGGRTPRRRAIDVAVFFGMAGLLVTAVYVAVGAVVFRQDSPASLLEWVFRYGGAQIPQWGAWGLDRVPSVLDSALSSIVPLKEVGGIEGVLRLGVGPTTVLPLIGLAAGLVLAVVVGWSMVRCGGLRALAIRHGWLVIGYAVFLPFLVWWDPFEPKWFVVPNLFLAGALSVGLGSVLRFRALLVVAVLSTLVLASCTFATVIWPRKTELSSRQLGASCVAEHLGPDDVYLALDWKWDGYLRYEHNIRVVSVIGLASRAPSPESLRAMLQSEVARATAGGGHAFSVDPASYPRGQRMWLQRQTGLDAGDLECFVGEPAFECNGKTILRLERVR
jgi:hypothetical protein